MLIMLLLPLEVSASMPSPFPTYRLGAPFLSSCSATYDLALPRLSFNQLPRRASSHPLGFIACDCLSSWNCDFRLSRSDTTFQAAIAQVPEMKRQGHQE